LLIGQSDYVVVPRLQPLCPFGIILGPAIVNTAVYFDNQLALGAVEIPNKSTHRMLPTKLETL
jgi:hypothetical protein